MPFKSQKQRAWMYENHPEMAKKWEKHTPKGKKLPKYVNKKKSRIESLKLIIAEDIQVATPNQLGQPIQSQQGQTQNNIMDQNTLISMVPEIMKKLNTSKINEVSKYLINNMNINPASAQQAVNAFAVKIYNEEVAKRQDKLVQDVASKMGVSPDTVRNWNKSSPLPQLSPLGASMRLQKLKTIIKSDRLASIINNDKKVAMLKHASLDDTMEQAERMSPEEKRLYLKKFTAGGITTLVNKIIETIKNIRRTLPENSSEKTPESNPIPEQIPNKIMNAPVTAGKMGDALYNTSILSMIVGLLMFSGTKVVTPEYWAAHPEDATHMLWALGSITSFGISGLAAILSSFFLKKEYEEEAHNEFKKNRMYQGPRDLK